MKTPPNDFLTPTKYLRVKINWEKIFPAFGHYKGIAHIIEHESERPLFSQTIDITENKGFVSPCTDNGEYVSPTSDIVESVKKFIYGYTDGLLEKKTNIFFCQMRHIISFTALYVEDKKVTQKLIFSTTNNDDVFIRRAISSFLKKSQPLPNYILCQICNETIFSTEKPETMYYWFECINDDHIRQVEKPSFLEGVIDYV